MHSCTFIFYMPKGSRDLSSSLLWHFKINFIRFSPPFIWMKKGALLGPLFSQNILYLYNNNYVNYFRFHLREKNYTKGKQIEQLFFLVKKKFIYSFAHLLLDVFFLYSLSSIFHDCHRAFIPLFHFYFVSFYNLFMNNSIVHGDCSVKIFPAAPAITHKKLCQKFSNLFF